MRAATGTHPDVRQSRRKSYCRTEAFGVGSDNSRLDQIERLAAEPDGKPPGKPEVLKQREVLGLCRRAGHRLQPDVTAGGNARRLIRISLNEAGRVEVFIRSSPARRRCVAVPVVTRNIIGRQRTAGRCATSHAAELHASAERQIIVKAGREAVRDRSLVARTARAEYRCPPEHGFRRKN